MFRTSSVHHQERFVEAVFAEFGMWYYYAYSSTRPAVTKFLALHVSDFISSSSGAFVEAVFAEFGMW